jgi:hypothetical protein
VGALEILGILCVSLAGLSLLPLFPGKGIQRAIRWSLVLLGLAAATYLSGYLPVLPRAPDPLPIVGAVVYQIAFSVATTLIAVLFKRAERVKIPLGPDSGSSTPPAG